MAQPEDLSAAAGMDARLNVVNPLSRPDQSLIFARCGEEVLQDDMGIGFAKPLSRRHASTG
jgi:hypothetical protein